MIRRVVVGRDYRFRGDLVRVCARDVYGIELMSYSSHSHYHVDAATLRQEAEEVRR